MSKGYVPQRRRIATPDLAEKGVFGKVNLKARTLTNSARGTFMNCRRKYAFEYLHLLAPRRTNIPFLVGGLFHDGLEWMYKNGFFDAETFGKKVHKAVKEAATSALDTQQSDKIWIQEAIIMGMLKGYERLYLEIDLKEYEVLSTESSFAIPLDHGWTYKGKRDMVMRHKKTKAVWLWEHKTTSQLDSGYIAKLPLDNQILGYAWSLIKEIGSVEKVMYNVTKKPGIKQKQTETFEQYRDRVLGVYCAEPERYFYREPVLFSQKQIDRFVDELNRFVGEMEAAVQSGYFYQNAGHCTAYGKCEFMPICVNGPSKDILQQYRQKTSAHEELEGVPDSKAVKKKPAAGKKVKKKRRKV